MFVVKDGQRRIVMSFEDEQNPHALRAPTPAGNFGRAFRKLYQKANGIK